MKSVLAVLNATLGLLLSFSLAAGAALQVHESWIREAPPTATVLAAYMVIRNTGNSPARVTAITSPDFDHIELHRTIVESGVARMIPVEKLEIAAGETVSLEPGGMHLMLFNPRRSLRKGDTVTLVIHPADGSSDTFTVPVIQAAGEAAHQHH
jgi:periplasmic copper chaperone A